MRQVGQHHTHTHTQSDRQTDRQTDRRTPTPHLQVHRDALVLHAVDDLTAVAARVVEPQLPDDQRHVAGRRATQAHAAPETAVAAVAVAHGHHHLRLPDDAGDGVRGRVVVAVAGGEPGPLDARATRGAQLGLVAEVAGQDDAAAPAGRHQGLLGLHVQLHPVVEDWWQRGGFM